MNFWRMSCFVCSAFGFALIGFMFRTVSFVAAIIIGVGVTFYVASFFIQIGNDRMKWMILIATGTAWSLGVFIAMSQLIAVPSVSTVPLWMKQGSVYIAPFVTLLLVWLPRLSIRQFPK